jgi:hypothetical protein
MAPTEPALSVRKPAIAAARGSVLALHAAAGMATSVDREAARMLRASEGLARAAVARLELTGQRHAASSVDAAAASAAAGSAKMGKRRGGTQNSTTSGKKSSEDKKGKGKGMSDVPMEASFSQPSADAAPLRAAAAPFLPGAEFELELDDEWADGTVPFGPANAPPAAAPEAAQPQRVLKARRSGTRSPRRGDEEPQLPSTLASPLVAGHVAAIKKLDSRPELENEKVLLLEYVPSSGRWICALSTGENLRILLAKLQSMNPSFQELAKQAFKKNVI